MKEDKMAANDDSLRIVTMAQTFLPEDKLKELLIKLDEEIGKKSENEITKKFLSGLRAIIDKPLPPAPLWLWICFYVLVVFHVLLVIGVLGSFFILPIYAPWYLALPSMTFIWFFSTTRVECQLTNLENVIRKRLGMKKIGGFVGNYFIRPIKMLWKKNGILSRFMPN
jgi:hypothetical protein